MATPENMKFLGGKGDKINKNHLTPCRRVGLPRKIIKTTPFSKSDEQKNSATVSPANPAKKANEEKNAHTLSNKPQKRSSANADLSNTAEKSPVQPTKKLKELTQPPTTDKDATDVEDKQRKSKLADKKKKKTPAKQLSISEECPLSQTSEASVNVALKQSLEVDNCDVIDNTSNDASDNVISSNKKQNTRARLLSDSDEDDVPLAKMINEKAHKPDKNENLVNEAIKYEAVEKNLYTVTAQDEKICSPVNNEPKKLRKSLSLKTNSPASQHSEIDSKALLTSMEVVTETEEENPLTKQPELKLHECSVILKTSPVVLTTLGPDEIANLKDKINKVKKRIKVKQYEIDKLKQVAIYKKMHKIEELQHLTMLWKIGCKKALNDLLAALNRHNKINMNTLLNKLNIPKDVISCTPNGTLI